MGAGKSLGIAGLVAAVLCFACHAGAEIDEQQRRRCIGDDDASPELRIGACTALIAAGRLSTENLTLAFNRRGNA